MLGSVHLVVGLRNWAARASAVTSSFYSATARDFQTQAQSAQVEAPRIGYERDLARRNACPNWNLHLTRMVPSLTKMAYAPRLCVCRVEDGSPAGARHGRSQQSGVRSQDTHPFRHARIPLSVRRSRAVIDQHYGRALRCDNHRHCPLTRPSADGHPLPRGERVVARWKDRNRSAGRQVRASVAVRPGGQAGCRPGDRAVRRTDPELAVNSRSSPTQSVC
jgi:hypothetical protein